MQGSVWEVTKATGKTIEIPFHDFQDDDELVIKGGKLYKKDWGEIKKLEKRFGLVLLNGQKKIMDGDLRDNTRSWITSLIAPELLEIGEWAFCRCQNLKNITIPKVQIIGKSAFCSCDGIEYIKLPASLEKIRGNPFEACTALKAIDVDFDNPVYESIDGVLYTRGSKRLKTLVAYPGGRDGEFVSDIAEWIGDKAFVDCGGLSGISLPNLRGIENTNTWESNTFYGCDNLKRVHLPALSCCRGNPFANCQSLEWIETDPSNPAFESKDGVLYTKGQMTIVAYPCAREGDFANAEVLFVGRAAFACSGVASVSLPNARVVDDIAFYHCVELVCVSLPNVSYFGFDVFSWCVALYVIRLWGAPVYSSFHCVGVCNFDEDTTKFILLPEAHKYDEPTLKVSFWRATMKFIDLPINCEVKTILHPSGIVTIRLSDCEFLHIKNFVERLSDFKTLDSEQIDNFVDALKDCHKELTNYGFFFIDLQLKIDVSGFYDKHDRQRGFVYHSEIFFLFKFNQENALEETSVFYWGAYGFEEIKECLSGDDLKNCWRRLAGLDFIRGKEVVANIKIDNEDDSIRKNETRELIEKMAENLQAVIE